MDEMHKLTQLKAEVSADLTGNILPFWLGMIDDENGGFYGQVTFGGILNKEAGKGGIYISRVLWTFSRAYRLLGKPDYLRAANAAYDFLLKALWDPEHGGIYWSVDAAGNPIDTKKMFYVQAFAIYGLSEYYRCTENNYALERAKELYGLIEQHAYDPHRKGYFEGASRDWKTVEPMRLGEDEPLVHKSMNTHLHILEAYSNLLLAWNDDGLRLKQGELVRVMTQHIIDIKSMHFKLFFDSEWNTHDDHISYGHDIEGSWLLEEAARILGDKYLKATVDTLATKMAETVFNEGTDANGIIQWEGDSTGVIDQKKYWWALAEQVVGFFNLYEMTDDPRYLKTTLKAWGYIQSHLIDQEQGEWIWGRSEDGNPIPADKAGIWKGPYHNGRMGFELIERIERWERESSDADQDILLAAQPQ